MTRVQSVERAIALLSAVGHRGGGLVELAHAAALPTSTAARLLSTLEGASAVVRHADGTYGIGPAITDLAGPAGGPGGGVAQLPDVAAPHMQALTEQFDEAVGLSVRSGRDIATIVQVDAPKPVQAQDWTGSRWPLFAGCSGVVLMATWTDKEVAAQLAGRLEALTEQTIVNPSVIRQRVARVRRDGVAWSHGEYVAELSSVAAAITDSNGRGFATLYVYGPSYRFPQPARADAVASAVNRHAREISAELAAWPHETRKAS